MDHHLADRIDAAQPDAAASLPAAIQRYLAGESVQVLARELSISRHTLYLWMMRRVGPAQWAELKKDALVMRIAVADEELSTSRTLAEVSRATALCRFSRMDYERLAPAEYGPKHDITTDSRLTVIVQRQPDQVQGERGEREEVSHLAVPGAVIVRRERGGI